MCRHRGMDSNTRGIVLQGSLKQVGRSACRFSFDEEHLCVVEVGVWRQKDVSATVVQGRIWRSKLFAHKFAMLLDKAETLETCSLLVIQKIDRAVKVEFGSGWSHGDGDKNDFWSQRAVPLVNSGVVSEAAGKEAMSVLSKLGSSVQATTKLLARWISKSLSRMIHQSLVGSAAGVSVETESVLAVSNVELRLIVGVANKHTAKCRSSIAVVD